MVIITKHMFHYEITVNIYAQFIIIAVGVNCTVESDTEDYPDKYLADMTQ